MGNAWYAYNAATAAWLSACCWYLPDVNYWEIAFRDVLRSRVLPNIPGI